MHARAGLETSITRTPLASTHILSVLSGSSTITVPCLASALVALFITMHHPFIMSQRDRQDMALKARAPACCLSLPTVPPSDAHPTVTPGVVCSCTARHPSHGVILHGKPVGSLLTCAGCP